MKKILVIVLGLAALGHAFGAKLPARFQEVMTNFMFTSSRSGQFVVASKSSATLAARFPGIATNLDFIALEPALLAVSCERIKESLYRELGAPDSWKGKIYLNLHEARSSDETITVVKERTVLAWNYRIELPDVLERNRFVNAIVQVLLLEMANRNGTERSAEVPMWLAEGLTQELIAVNEMEIILPPPRFYENGVIVKRLNVNERKPHPLAQAQQVLNTRAPLTFEQLSWPTEEQLAGEALTVYRSSAQFFVYQLLHLKNGTESMQAMLATLPQRLNWQTAFYEAFRSTFQRPLDVEKWWALQLVQFAGRDLTRMWTFEESWRRLDEALRTPVQVRTRESNTPLHTTVSLQNVISEWDRIRQTQTLKKKYSELGLVRMRVTQDLIPLVDNYRAAIETFLRNRNPNGPILARKASDRVDPAVAEAVKALDELDQQRVAFRPEPQAALAH